MKETNKITPEKQPYVKAASEIVQFENVDVLTASGGGCTTWSNQSGVSCHYGLTAS